MGCGKGKGKGKGKPKIVQLTLLIVFILFFAINAGAENIPMQWNFPESEIVDGFKLYQSKDGAPYDYDNPVATFAPNQREGSVDITYTPGVIEQYTWVLRSFSGSLSSTDSNEINYPSVGTVPQKPVNLTATYDSNTVHLSWFQPDDPIGYLIEKTYIFYRLDGETDLTQLAEVPFDINHPETDPIIINEPFTAVQDGEMRTVYFTVLPMRRSGVQGEYADAFSVVIDRRSGLPAPSGLQIMVSIPMQ